MKDGLAEANIELLTIPAHMSHILQSVDLEIFGALKLFLRKRFNNSMMEDQTLQVIKICDAWQRATVPRNNVDPFSAADMVPYPGRDHRWYLKFEESEANQLHNYFP
jgi:hypothetical protein